MSRKATLHAKKIRKQSKIRKINAAELFQQVRELDLEAASPEQLRSLSRLMNVYLTQVPYAHSSSNVSSLFLDFFFHCNEEELLGGNRLSDKLACLFGEDEFDGPDNSADFLSALRRCEDCYYYFNGKNLEATASVAKKEFFTLIRDELLFIVNDRKNSPPLQKRALHFLMLAGILLSSKSDEASDLFDGVYEGAVSREMRITPKAFMETLRAFNPEDAETGVQVFDWVYSFTFQVSALLKSCGIKSDLDNRSNFSIFYFYEIFSKADVESLKNLCDQLQTVCSAFLAVNQTDWRVFSNMTQSLPNVPLMKERILPIQQELDKERLKDIASNVMAEHALSDEFLVLFSDPGFYQQLESRYSLLPAEAQKGMDAFGAVVDRVVETCEKLLDHERDELVGLRNRHFAMQFLLTPGIFQRQGSKLQMYVLVAAKIYANSCEDSLAKYFQFTSAVDQSFDGASPGEEIDFSEAFSQFDPEWVDELDELNVIFEGMNRIKVGLSEFILAFPKKNAALFGNDSDANYGFFLDLHASYTKLSSQIAHLSRLLAYGESLSAIYQDHVRSLCAYIEKVIEIHGDPDEKLGFILNALGDRVGLLQASADLFQQLSQKNISEQDFINALLDRGINCDGESIGSIREILKEATVDRPLDGLSSSDSTFLTRIMGVPSSPSKEGFRSPRRSSSIGHSLFGRSPVRRRALPIELFVTSNYLADEPVELDFSAVLPPVNYAPQPDFLRRDFEIAYRDTDALPVLADHSSRFARSEHPKPSLAMGPDKQTDLSTVTLDFSGVSPAVNHAPNPAYLRKDSPLHSSKPSVETSGLESGGSNTSFC